MVRNWVLIASMIALLTTQTQAAIVQLEGSAFVDKGQGFARATNNMQLNPGDRIRAGDGCALIVYRTGYQAKVCDGQMAVVLSEPPSPVGAGSLNGEAMYASAGSQGDWIAPTLLLGAGVGIACGIACGSGKDQVSP